MVEVTAVELDPDIATIYQDFFPDDTVIVGDAHQYLLDHYNDGWDFIWASPPCPTHSRMNHLTEFVPEKTIKYPDMMLYQEIILLQTFFKGKYCVENVISYYEPLIKPTTLDNHYFWSNFHISTYTGKIDRQITRMDDIKVKGETRGFDLTGYDKPIRFLEKLLNNCVFPKVGLHIFDCAFHIKQEVLF